MLGRKLLAFAFTLIAAPCLAQPATPCTPNAGSWVYTTTTVQFYRCAADGLSWITVAPLSTAPDWTVITSKPAAVTNLFGTNTGDQTTVSGNAGTATKLAATKTINGVAFDGSANITVPASGSTLTDAVSFANGGLGACAATSATTGTITVNMTTPCISTTPTGAMTLNASGGVAGQIVVFSITTSGTNSFTLTFGTNFRKTGTLATGTVSARFFTVTFYCLDGTTWTEVARTAVQS